MPAISLVAAVASSVAAGFSALAAWEASSISRAQHELRAASVHFDFHKEGPDLLVCQVSGEPYPLRNLHLTPVVIKNDTFDDGSEEEFEVQMAFGSDDQRCRQAATIADPMRELCPTGCLNAVHLRVEYTLYGQPESDVVSWTQS